MPMKRPPTTHKIANCESVEFYIAMSQKNDRKSFWRSTGCKKLRQQSYAKQRALAQNKDDKT